MVLCIDQYIKITQSQKVLISLNIEFNLIIHIPYELTTYTTLSGLN